MRPRKKRTDNPAGLPFEVIVLAHLIRSTAEVVVRMKHSNRPLNVHPDAAGTLALYELTGSCSGNA